MARIDKEYIYGNTEPRKKVPEDVLSDRIGALEGHLFKLESTLPRNTARILDIQKEIKLWRSLNDT